MKNVNTSPATGWTTKIVFSAIARCTFFATAEVMQTGREMLKIVLPAPEIMMRTAINSSWRNWAKLLAI
jgi:hypothetical protein